MREANVEVLFSQKTGSIWEKHGCFIKIQQHVNPNMMHLPQGFVQLYICYTARNNGKIHQRRNMNIIVPKCEAGSAPSLALEGTCTHVQQVTYCIRYCQASD